MVVTSGIERAIQYFHAIQAYLAERKSPYRAIVAFSGEHEYGGAKVTEASLNGFPSSDDRRPDPGGPVPVPRLRRQVPDRLRRAAAAHDVRRQAAVGRQGGADPVAAQPRPPAEARRVRARLPERRRRRSGRRSSRLLPDDDPQRGDRSEQAARPQGRRSTASRSTTADRSSSSSSSTSAAPTASSSTRSSTPASRPTSSELDEDGQVDFKGKAKAFVRTYGFLVAILPYANAEWEKLSIFLELPDPQAAGAEGGGPVEGHPRSRSTWTATASRSRPCRRSCSRTQNAEIEPVPTEGGGRRPEPELDRLSNILKTFNELFGGIDWTDARPGRAHDHRRTSRTVAADVAYQNARENSDTPTARMEHDQALGRVIVGLMKDDTELFKQYQRQSRVQALADRHCLRRDLSGRAGSRVTAALSCPFRAIGVTGYDCNCAYWLPLMFSRTFSLIRVLRSLFGSHKLPDTPETLP